MNILEIVVLAAALLFGVTGYRRGFVRKLASMLSLVVSIVLVSVFLPYMTDFLKNNTPVYDSIVKQCRQTMENQIAETFSPGTGLNNGGIPDSYRGTEEERISGRAEQNELIENLPLPDVLKDLLLDNNNDEGYADLRVYTFQDYVVHFIATAVLNVISFVAAVLLVQLALSLVLKALDFLLRIPVVSLLNRMAGFLLGLLEAVFFLWLFFLILSMVSGTEIGLWLMSMVQESSFLGSLYDSNLFMQIVLKAASVFIG